MIVKSELLKMAVRVVVAMVHGVVGVALQPAVLARDFVVDIKTSITHLRRVVELALLVLCGAWHARLARDFLVSRLGDRQRAHPHADRLAQPGRLPRQHDDARRCGRVGRDAAGVLERAKATVPFCAGGRAPLGSPDLRRSPLDHRADLA